MKGQINSGNSNQVYISLDFSPMTEFVAVGSTDSIVQVWNYQTLKQKQQFLGHQGKVDSVSFT